MLNVKYKIVIKFYLVLFDSIYPKDIVFCKTEKTYVGLDLIEMDYKNSVIGPGAKDHKV